MEGPKRGRFLAHFQEEVLVGRKRRNLGTSASGDCHEPGGLSSAEWQTLLFGGGAMGGPEIEFGGVSRTETRQYQTPPFSGGAVGGFDCGSGGANKTRTRLYGRDRRAAGASGHATPPLSGGGAGFGGGITTRINELNDRAGISHPRTPPFFGGGLGRIEVGSDARTPRPQELDRRAGTSQLDNTRTSSELAKQLAAATEIEGVSSASKASTRPLATDDAAIGPSRSLAPLSTVVPEERAPPQPWLLHPTDASSSRVLADAIKSPLQQAPTGPSVPPVPDQLDTAPATTGERSAVSPTPGRPVIPAVGEAPSSAPAASTSTVPNRPTGDSALLPTNCASNLAQTKSAGSYGHVIEPQSDAHAVKPARDHKDATRSGASENEGLFVSKLKAPTKVSEHLVLGRFGLPRSGRRESLLVREILMGPKAAATPPTASQVVLASKPMETVAARKTAVIVEGVDVDGDGDETTSEVVGVSPATAVRMAEEILGENLAGPNLLEKLRAGPNSLAIPAAKKGKENKPKDGHVSVERVVSKPAASLRPPNKTMPEPSSSAPKPQPENKNGVAPRATGKRKADDQRMDVNQQGRTPTAPNQDALTGPRAFPAAPSGGRRPYLQSETVGRCFERLDLEGQRMLCEEDSGILKRWLPDP